jgi:hypothetical protein
MTDRDQRSCFSTTKADSHEQLISNAGWSKLDFAERDQCKPFLLRLSLAGNLKKHLCPSTVYGTEWRERCYGLKTVSATQFTCTVYDRYGEEKAPCKKRSFISGDGGGVAPPPTAPPYIPANFVFKYLKRTYPFILL